MKLRNFLKRNEIYFTTLTAVSLAVISIFLAIQENRNSRAQTAVAKRQEKMDYFSNLPTFQIEQEYYWNKDTTQIIGLELEVSKINGSAKNIFLSSITILNIEFKLPKENPVKDYICLDDFFLSITFSGKLDGKICTIQGFSDNYKLLCNTANELKQLIIKDSADYAVIDQETYIQISYTNFINESVVNYYKLSPTGASFLCDNETIDYVKQLYQERLYHNNNKSQIYMTGIKQSDLEEIYEKIKTTANVYTK